MFLFESEVINITKILSVDTYVTTEKEAQQSPTARYSSAPRAYELIYFLSGGCDTHFCGTDMRDTPDSVRYLPKGEFEGEYIVRNRCAGSCIDIYFDTDTPLPMTAMSFPNMSFLKNKFIKMFNVWNSRKPGYYSGAQSIFYDIIHSFKKSRDIYIPQKSTERLAAAHEYILENYRRADFSYTALCDTTGLSYSYFSELFIARFGMSPVKYVTRMRVDYAMELLLTGKYSVTEISEKCGFSDVYYFSKVFKKLTGTSPGKWA